MIKKISSILITTSLILFSCCSIKNTKSKSENIVDIKDKLEGFWISANEDYEKSDKTTILFYGEIDKSMTGVYLQGEKEFKYRIVNVDKSNKKIEIAIKFSSSRERIETLTFSEDYNQILNNIVTPDGFSIDTYYIRKE